MERGIHRDPGVSMFVACSGWFEIFNFLSLFLMLVEAFGVNFMFELIDVLVEPGSE